MLLGLALEQGILTTFKHHYYSFDDQGVVRLQGEGGPIGLKRGRVEGGGGARVVCTEEGGRVERIRIKLSLWYDEVQDCLKVI